MKKKTKQHCSTQFVCCNPSLWKHQEHKLIGKESDWYYRLIFTHHSYICSAFKALDYAGWTSWSHFMLFFKNILFRCESKMTEFSFFLCELPLYVSPLKAALFTIYTLTINQMTCVQLKVWDITLNDDWFVPFADKTNLLSAECTSTAACTRGPLRGFAASRAIADCNIMFVS